MKPTEPRTEERVDTCLRCGEPLPTAAVSLFCTGCVARAGGTFKLNGRAL